MVSFQCDSCGDVVKKPKLDGHRCHSSFTCLDCSTTFYTPAEWKPHSTCITEAQKYEKGKGQSANRGAQASQQPRNNYRNAQATASQPESSSVEGLGNYERRHEPAQPKKAGWNNRRGMETTGPNVMTPAAGMRVWGSNAPSASPKETTPDTTPAAKPEKRKLDEAEPEDPTPKRQKVRDSPEDRESRTKKDKKQKKDKKERRQEGSDVGLLIFRESMPLQTSKVLLPVDASASETAVESTIEKDVDATVEASLSSNSNDGTESSSVKKRSNAEAKAARKAAKKAAKEAMNDAEKAEARASRRAERKQDKKDRAREEEAARPKLSEEEKRARKEARKAEKAQREAEKAEKEARRLAKRQRHYEKKQRKEKEAQAAGIETA